MDPKPNFPCSLKMMMPEDHLASIVYATNQQPLIRNHPHKLYQFSSIILAMGLAPKGDQRDLWNIGTYSSNEFWEVSDLMG